MVAALWLFNQVVGPTLKKEKKGRLESLVEIITCHKICSTAVAHLFVHYKQACHVPTIDTTSLVDQSWICATHLSLTFHQILVNVMTTLKYVTESD